MKTINRQPKIVDLLRRLVRTAAFLLALSLAEFCSAAEATFGGHYSVELPAGWSGQAKKDKILTGAGSGGVSFGFGASHSEISAEEYVEKDLANTEKRPGYKLIEKGAVKSSAGRKATLLRYQTDGSKGPETNVKYYLQLADKEVVVLLFWWPSNSTSKPPKSEIESIFNSVKLAATADQDDDSWLTTPADKSKDSSTATGAGDSQIAGKYVSTRQSSDYIVLKADGTFSGEVQGESHTGTYTRNGATISFKFSETVSEDLKLEKDALIDKKGYRWVKSTAR